MQTIFLVLATCVVGDAESDARAALALAAAELKAEAVEAIAEESSEYPLADFTKVATGGAEKLHGWVRPRAKISGKVALVKKEADGDHHIRLENGKEFVILEEIPELPLPSLPKVGDEIEAWGVVRFDGEHKWSELHPLVGWRAKGKATVGFSDQAALPIASEPAAKVVCPCGCPCAKGGDCTCGENFCDCGAACNDKKFVGRASHNYRWVRCQDADQIALYDGDKQVGTWRYDKKLYYPFDGERWSSYPYDQPPPGCPKPPTKIQAPDNSPRGEMPKPDARLERNMNILRIWSAGGKSC